MLHQRVLLADRDASLLARYRTHLAKEGFTVTTAQTALECLERLGDAVPDVFVLDPEVLAEVSDGAFELLADGDDLPCMHVIVLTAADCDLRSRFVHVPVSAWHVKPLTPSALAQQIRRVLNLPAKIERFVTEWA